MLLEYLKCKKKAIRILYRLNQTDSGRTYFSKTNTLTLPSLYVLKTLEYIKQNETNFIQRSMIHNHYTRNCTKLNVNQCRLSKNKNGNPQNIGLKLYNHVPQ